MPAESNNNTPVASPSFLGLQYYTEAQANSFFGRDAEIESLTTLVNVNTLTIVFGKSGTGKTSLLNAGVFPRLRKNYCLPFRIRLEFNDDSPGLVSQIKKVLKEEIDKYGFKVKSYPTSETLWEYFHKEPLWEMVTPILVFDQFEEIFTLAKTNPRFAVKELPVFWEELSDIIENTIPEKLLSGFLEQKEKIDYNYKKQKTKVVFGFREEYLPEFENIAAKIPSIKYSRFRLMQMNGHQAYEVITKTWKENISPSEAKQIVSYLTNETDQESYDLITVEPSLLSQVCAYIDKERIGTGSNKVSAEFLNKYPKETILRSIYNEAVTTADNALHIAADSKEKVKRNHVKEFLEERLITSEGFRARYNLAEKDEYLRPGIGVLQNKYFIREDNNTVELTHDVLAPVIKRDREKRRRAAALVAERKKARRKVLIILLVTLLAAGGFWALAAIQSNKAINQLKDARDSLVVINRLIKEGDSILKSGSGSSSNNKLAKPVPVITPVFDSTLLKNLLERVRNDSLELEGLKIKNEELLKGRTLQIETITAVQKKSDSIYQDAKNHIQVLGKKILKDSLTIIGLNKEGIIANERIRILRDSIAFLQQMIQKQQEVINDLIKKGTNPQTLGNLRVSIYDSVSQKLIPNDKLDVYIIPLTSKNNEILNTNINIMQNKDCDASFDNLLKKLNNYQKAFYSGGYYYFPEVIQNGRYKIKICSIFDGYYDLKMPNSKEVIYWKRKNAPTIGIKLGKFK